MSAGMSNGDLPAVLITGCTPGGLGLETAKQIGLSGAYLIYLCCRDGEKLEAARNEVQEAFQAASSQSKVAELECLVDLSSLESVRGFAENFAKNAPRLDILINNAGIMRIPKYKLSKDGFEMHFAVNYLSHFLLTLILTPLLLETSKRSGGIPSRVINLSTDFINTLIKKVPDPEALPPIAKGYDATMVYSYSKLLVVYHSTELLRRYYVGKGPEEPKIFACSLHPGVIRTNLLRHDNSCLVSTFFFIANAYSYCVPSNIHKPISVEDGAKTSVLCATMKDLPTFNLENGDDIFLYYMNLKLTPVKEQLRSLKVAEEIWNKTEKELVLQSRS